MPVKVRIKGGEFKFITPTTVFKPMDLTGVTKDNLEVTPIITLVRQFIEVERPEALVVPTYL
jgi:hypothetical protein